MIKKFIIPFCFSIAALQGCNTENTQNANTEVSIERVPVVKLSTQTTTIYTTKATNIEAVQNVEIRSHVRGYIDKIFFDEGSAVDKNQLLFTIIDSEYAVAVSKAKAHLANATSTAKSAQIELERVGIMVDKKVISKTELAVSRANMDADEARIDEAAAQLADAQLKFSYTKIKAPFAGLVNDIPLKKGSLVEDGTLLTSLSDIGKVYAYFDLSENQYLEYMQNRATGKNNQIVRLILSDGRLYEYEGYIETLRGQFDQKTGSIALRAVFKNKGNLLRHGSTGKIRLSHKVENAILIPQKAVFEIQDKHYVFVVGKDSIVRMKSFVPGSRQSVYYVVQSGLKAGDIVVYEGIQNIKDGIKIKPVVQLPDTLNG